jgi:DNA-binding NtrC family response regulator
MSNVKVLLVDDEVEYVETMAERLRLRGFEVDVATSGEQAIAKTKTKKSQYGAVVLDYAMPMMDGIATIKALRELEPSLPFILLSGETTIKVALQAARLGAVDVLEKPVDISTIIEKIELADG